MWISEKSASKDRAADCAKRDVREDVMCSASGRPREATGMANNKPKTKMRFIETIRKSRSVLLYPLRCEFQCARRIRR